VTILRTYDQSWDGACEPGGGCTSAGLFAILLNTPAQVDLVQVFASITLDFEISSRDAATVEFHAGNAFGEFVGGPGAFQVSSSGRTSTTLMWKISSLPAQGMRYTLDALVRPVDLDGGGSTVTGQLVTVYVQEVSGHP
jgi:hypothetical protein